MLSRALVANLTTWAKRRRTLFFLIEHVAQTSESRALSRTATGFNHPVSEFLHQTFREALRGVQDPTSSIECLGYLTELFWMLCTEAVRLVQDTFAGVLALKVRPSPTEGLLSAFIEVADLIESELPPGKLSFIRVFSCHQKFKETLVAVTSHITANRMDTAERRTDRMRQYLTSRSMQSLLPKRPGNRKVSESLSSTPVAKTRQSRRASSVMYLQSDHATVSPKSPSDQREVCSVTQATAPLDEALDLPEVAAGVSLNWLRAQVRSESRLTSRFFVSRSHRGLLRKHKK